jgi:antitoxin FitA
MIRMKSYMIFHINMANITIQNLDDVLKSRLSERAAVHGRSIEDEAREILRTVLEENLQSPKNLAESIRSRFTAFESFDLPEIPREAIRNPPSFE